MDGRMALLALNVASATELLCPHCASLAAGYAQDARDARFSAFGGEVERR